MNTTNVSITIRPAFADDEDQVARLAILDSSEAPQRPLLLAEVDGELRAALSLDSGSAIADPFFPTAHLISLLRAHALAIPRPRAPRPARRLVRAALSH